MKRPPENFNILIKLALIQISLLIPMFSICGIAPPDPGADPSGGGPPVGGGAPIGEGSYILIGAVLLYSVIKILKYVKDRKTIVNLEE